MFIFSRFEKLHSIVVGLNDIEETVMGVDTYRAWNGMGFIKGIYYYILSTPEFGSSIE